MNGSRVSILAAGLVLGSGTDPGLSWRSIAAAAPSGQDSRTVRFDGFGPVKVGMSVVQASAGLGLDLKEDSRESAESCSYFSSPALTGIAFMVLRGKVARVDVVRDRRYRTTAGARVGMTEAQLTRLYPKIIVTPNQYDDEWHDLRVDSPDGRFALIFVTDGKGVVGYRSGLREPVGWIEGCL